MSAREILLHGRKKWRQLADSRGERDWSAVHLEPAAFPKLPLPSAAPTSLREAFVRDADEILAGRWRAFGALPLAVDDPPRWHKDYLANVDVPSSENAFRLNHRALPRGADIKLIWELSRWHALTRLAMAAYILDHERAGEKCIVWLEDWVKNNPPGRGWNWTSALETGLRLIQFSWIDALLAPEAERWGFDAELDTLRYAIVPPHARFTWRHRSFGSSANNHLMGELAGLIAATARWPGVESWAAPLDVLQPLWENEVLSQFAEDGGNREQALNYHLFSFELALHARNALLAAGRTPSAEVDTRLDAAMRFFWDVQADREPWDYGDSDNAFVLPLFTHDATFVREWRRWMGRANSAALDFWLDAPPLRGRPVNSGPPLRAREVAGWWHYADSGIAVCESGLWWLRWDLSPLGYLRTGAHGHLDALHLSVWCNGVAFIIDPGTGAYFADQPLRNWVSSRAAHNAPCPPGAEWPARAGAFLWAEHHAPPVVEAAKGALAARLTLDLGRLERRIEFTKPGSFDVVDQFIGVDENAGPFTVCWQFAPGTWVQRRGRSLTLNRQNVSIGIEPGADWAEIELVEAPPSPGSGQVVPGTVSSVFRRTEWAPYLKLTAAPRPGQSCLFRTTFVASRL